MKMSNKMSLDSCVEVNRRIEAIHLETILLSTTLNLNDSLKTLENFAHKMLPVLAVLYLAGSVAAQDYCNPSPCGKNTDCTLENGRPVCACKSTFIGDPLQACQHECEKDEDCSADKGCLNYRCKDPCVRGCGDYASCRVQNHQAICVCPQQYGGDAYKKCIPECISKEECPSHLSCIDYHCGNPCRENNPCGRNTDCKVERHTVICTCTQGFVGEPLGQGCRRRS